MKCTILCIIFRFFSFWNVTGLALSTANFVNDTTGSFLLFISFSQFWFLSAPTSYDAISQVMRFGSDSTAAVSSFFQHKKLIFHWILNPCLFLKMCRIYKNSLILDIQTYTSFRLKNRAFCRFSLHKYLLNKMTIGRHQS